MSAPAQQSRERSFEAVVRVKRGMTSGAPIVPARARKLLKSLARVLCVPHDSVAVVFGDDTLLADFNHRYRGRSGATDVLSFPAEDAAMSDAPAGERHLGDIVISCQAARRQGRSRRHSAARETEILLVHGFLHLLGYDHEVDDGEMEFLEQTLRARMIAGARRT